tara:strand:- start:3246 stop:3623 length:378 start_codon:yes stop_codon:yes gene_type:complete
MKDLLKDKKIMLFVILGGLGILALKSLMQKRKIDQILQNNLNASLGQGQQAGFNADKVAEALYLAMHGLGTDEEVVYQIGQSLTDAQREKVKVAFLESYGESLRDYIEGDFGFGTRDEVLQLYGY